MNRALPPDVPKLLATGVTQPALMIGSCYLVWWPLLARLSRSMSIGPRVLTIVGMAVLASPLSIATSAESGVVWIQYVGAAIGGIGMTCCLQVSKVAVLLWWSPTGEAAFGASIMGGSIGVGAVAFTLVNAELCLHFQLAGAMYVITGIFAAIWLLPLWLVFTGALQAPPSTPPFSVAGSNHGSGKSSMSLGSLICSLSFWQFCLHASMLTFTGFGMKALLSPIFIESYDVDYRTAALVAALSLICYAFVRSGLPLLARKLSLAPLCGSMLGASAVIYSVCPTIIANLPIGWLVVAKSVTGANFAGVAVLLNLLVLEVFGAADFVTVYPYIGLATGLGFTTGPLTGYYLYIAHTGDNGGASKSDFNAFFYTCAVLTAASAMNMFVLQWRTRRAARMASEMCGPL
jgi:MFS family permease